MDGARVLLEDSRIPKASCEVQQTVNIWQESENWERRKMHNLIS